MFEPLLKRTNSRPAERISADVIRRLKENCDDVKTFTEAGVFYVIGFSGPDTIVLAHGDRDQYERMMNPSDKGLENGFGYRR